LNSRPLSEIRVPALDGLRGIAILLVLLNMFEVPQPDGVTSGAAIGLLESIMKTGWSSFSCCPAT
jgi:hypothetical protein